MDEWKEKVAGVIIALMCVLAVVAGYYFTIIHSTNYYTQINNSDVEKLSNNEYKYHLMSYDEHGKMKEFTFTARKELREDAFLLLETKSFRGVVNWEEVQYDELPKDVKPRYAASE